MCFPHALAPAAVAVAAEPDALDLASEIDFLMWLLSLTVDEPAERAAPMAAGAVA